MVVVVVGGGWYIRSGDVGIVLDFGWKECVVFSDRRREMRVAVREGAWCKGMDCCWANECRRGAGGYIIRCR